MSSEVIMEAIIERCCGLDVHQASIVACLLTGTADEKPVKQVRTFSTMTRDLHELSQWLGDNQCTHVAMESTGVYWMPVYKVLEHDFELVVGNANHLAKVPGRKTDVLDSQWLAELLRHGLIKSSFIPPPPIRELRDLTRYRRKLVQNRSAERNRLQKLLETANIKLASVMSDVFGVSGLAMVRALVEGKLTVGEIAKLAKGQLRKKLGLLQLAVDGTIEEHHRYLLRTQLERLEGLDRDIAALDQRINDKLSPYREQHTRLMQIPGVSQVAAAVIIAEMGVDMSVFPSAQACASWAGVCPGNKESAGKRQNGSSHRGNPHLKTILVEAAQCAARKKGSYLRDKFHRLKARRGYKRAAMAIAHKILLSAYHMLRTGEDYRELGETYLDARDEHRATQRLVRRLTDLGYQVTLERREPEDEPVTEPAAPGSDHDVRAGDQQQDLVAYSAGPSANAPLASSVQEHDSVLQQEGAAAPASERDPAEREIDAQPPIKRKRVRRRSAEPTHSAPPRDPRLPPAGTILTRRFKGAEYRVLITDEGFEYEGTVYSSLSRVAKVITGSHWNGFAFFRLAKPRQRGNKYSLTPRKPQ
jgi:transposase